MPIASVLASDKVEVSRTRAEPLEMKSPGSMLPISMKHLTVAIGKTEPLRSFPRVRCKTPKCLNKTSSATALTLHLHSDFCSNSIDGDTVPLRWLVEVKKKPLPAVMRQNVPRTSCLSSGTSPPIPFPEKEMGAEENVQLAS